MWRHLSPAFRITLAFTVLTGLAYPGLVTGLCELFFPRQANGSLLKAHGRVIGSDLIGQRFTSLEYFHSRPSAAGKEGYDATASSASNAGPASENLITEVKASVRQFRNANPSYSGPIPADLVTTSASGLDPDISPAAAFAQAARVAHARGIALEAVERLVREHIEPRELGFLGEPRVNVLELNLALDKEFPARKSAP